ncbi:MAG: hypothetical protein C4531_10085 [Desulfurivibrio sp.]|jgi:hypothetical protein|nr:MAG: hypothetical protein C4531_10085 [Desulfurivibrio sp.]
MGKNNYLKQESPLWIWMPKMRHHCRQAQRDPESMAFPDCRGSLFRKQTLFTLTKVLPAMIPRSDRESRNFPYHRHF